MIVDTHDGFRSPDRRRATRVVILDDFGQPLLAAIEVAPNNVAVVKAGDDPVAFAAILREFGLRPAPTTVTELPAYSGPVIR